MHKLSTEKGADLMFAALVYFTALWFTCIGFS